MSNLKVCIVEDNPQIQSLLEQIVQMNGEYEWLGSFSTAEDAIMKIPVLKPNIVLTDINLGDGKSGIDCVREVKANHPEILFMMCTVYEEDEKIFEALRAGANGYILKKTAPDKMLAAIKELSEGGAPMSSQIARKVVNAFAIQPQVKVQTTQVENSAMAELSKREREILEMIAKGMTYKEISELVFLAPETIRKHVYHIYDKLHVNNRVEAVNKFYGR
ncbi:MAG: response regulator transcription factor [Sphingobacteriales bacterium]|nr:response regulator transcription factor [Sphingobacteriales bacterium]MBI3717275.1 response regulator transcription factor [Sphingobacteriales bacterium]